ncbi:MAG: hypothetical protein AB1420_16050 [Bacillota bacterium]
MNKLIKKLKEWNEAWKKSENGRMARRFVIDVAIATVGIAIAYLNELPNKELQIVLLIGILGAIDKKLRDYMSREKEKNANS